MVDRKRVQNKVCVPVVDDTSRVPGQYGAVSALAGELQAYHEREDGIMLDCHHMQLPVASALRGMLSRWDVHRGPLHELPSRKGPGPSSTPTTPNRQRHDSRRSTSKMERDRPQKRLHLHVHHGPVLPQRPVGPIQLAMAHPVRRRPDAVGLPAVFRRVLLAEHRRDAARAVPRILASRPPGPTPMERLAVPGRDLLRDLHHARPVQLGRLGVVPEPLEGRVPGRLLLGRHLGGQPHVSGRLCRRRLLHARRRPDRRVRQVVAGEAFCEMGVTSE